MASWLSSLEIVLRLHSLASWVAIVSAALALASALFAYLLSNKAEGLREKARQQMQVERTLPSDIRLQAPIQPDSEQTSAQSEGSGEALEEVERLNRDVQQLRSSLEEAQEESRRSSQAAEEVGRQLDAEHRRAEVALAEVADKQEELAAVRAELDQLKAAPQQSEGQGPLTPHKKEKLLRALEGKPTGSLTLVSVTGNSSSQQLSRELAATLRQAGWNVDLREGVFSEVPDGLYFVVESQESMPQYTLQLAVGLAVIDLMPMPAKIRVNPEKPPGSLAIVVGEVRQ